MKQPSEKRKSTQLGLGKVTVPEAPRTTVPVEVVEATPPSGPAGARVGLPYVDRTPMSATHSETKRIQKQSGAPVPAAPAVTKPARSKRMSIREDDLGNRVKDIPDAVGAAGRVVPKLIKTKAEIAAAPIDHRAGFLLAHIDGVTTVQGLVDVCGMPEEEVGSILDRLRRLGIVAVR